MLSFTFLLLSCPLLVAAAAAVKFLSPGPAFYAGKRVGLNGRSFRVYKFRSMIIGAESKGGSATAEDDPRLTSIGLFLRKYKIDELPQLINVVLGDMSLVGPRPEVQKYVDMYSPEERRILTVRPGITDWASLWNFDEGSVLAGSANAEECYERVIRPTKIKLQLMYVRSASMRIDLQILFHTAMKLLLRSHWMPGPLKAYSSPSRDSFSTNQLPSVTIAENDLSADTTGNNNHHGQIASNSKKSELFRRS